MGPFLLPPVLVPPSGRGQILHHNGRCACLGKCKDVEGRERWRGDSSSWLSGRTGKPCQVLSDSREGREESSHSLLEQGGDRDLVLKVWLQHLSHLLPYLIDQSRFHLSRQTVNNGPFLSFRPPLNLGGFCFDRKAFLLSKLCFPSCLEFCCVITNQDSNVTHLEET